MISTARAGHELSWNVGDDCDVTIQNCGGYNPEEPNKVLILKCVPVNTTASDDSSTGGKCAEITDMVELACTTRYDYWVFLFQAAGLLTTLFL